MPRRKVPLAKHEIYHICSKSIADFRIFNSHKDFERILSTMSFYVIEKPPCKFSLFKELKEKCKSDIFIKSIDYSKRLVDIVAYCIMPTHIHLMLKQLKEGGISKFLHSVLMSYSHYFNIKYKRKGPLWENRFENILIKNDYQLIHTTRYIHLNPATARLVDDPVDWKCSSCREYMGLIKEEERLCSFSDYIDMDPASYAKFVNDQIDYQRQLASIKHLTLE